MIPAEMTALVADATATDEREAVSRLRVARVAVPQPGRGEVLVKMAASPCNPADLYYLVGRYGIDRPLPATPGFEGSGTVVASGGGLLARWLVGKRVACGGHDGSGTWAEYCVVEATGCMPLSKQLTIEQGAAALANPVTALALAGLVRAGRHRAYIQTAAAGQLGRMILAATRAPGIHVVRREDQAAGLRELGAEHVLVSASPTFDQELADRAKQLGATIALDAVAGPITGQLVAALPPHGEVVVYGALSGQPCSGIDPMTLAFDYVRVRGFEVAGHIKEMGLLRGFRLATNAQRRVRTGEFTTTIRDRVPLAEAPSRLAAYIDRMSDGKLLLVM
jgi:NADPH:quinone reductase